MIRKNLRWMAAIALASNLARGDRPAAYSPGAARDEVQNQRFRPRHRSST